MLCIALQSIENHPETQAEPAIAPAMPELPAIKDGNHAEEKDKTEDGKLAEEKPAEEKPVEETPAEEKQAEEKPLEEKQAEEKPAAEATPDGGKDATKARI